MAAVGRKCEFDAVSHCRHWQKSVIVATLSFWPVLSNRSRGSTRPITVTADCPLSCNIITKIHKLTFGALQNYDWRGCGSYI